MAIQIQSFGTILNNAVSAIQATSRQLLDFTVGSVLRAVMEATSAMMLWLQAIALQIASLTRFSTSNGTDADTWAADFNFARLSAKAATGSVTFARFTPTNPAVIPVGTPIQTADGLQKYQVIADTSQSAYSVSQSAYLIPAGTTTITATVQSTSLSSGGNAAAGFINTLGSAIVGVDTVTNPLAFANGADSESDADFRARFVLYIAGLSKATLAAIGSAIEDIQQDVTFAIVENQNFDGSINRGYFYVVVDDGSGNPPASFLTSVANAIDRVRAVGSMFGVFGPTLLSANVAMTITVDTGYDKPTLVGLVQAAVLAYIDSLTIGEILPFTRLAQIAYDVSPGVTNVSGITLNSVQADLVPTSVQVIRASSVTVS